MEINYKFTKYFKEPTEKYNCISISLFYLEKYIRTTKYQISYNASQKKIILFYKNLLKMDEFLKNGTYPKDLYLRFYFDKSILKVHKFLKLLKIFMKNKKIQLIKFEFDNLRTSHDNNQNLIGTFARFYSIFDESSKNMEYCILADADNIYTNNFFTIFNEFKSSGNLIYSCNSIIDTADYQNDYTDFTKLYNYIYFVANSTVVKRDKIFNIKYWDIYFKKMFQQMDLMYIYNYIDFKRYSFIKILDKKNYKIETNYDFCYGTDEVWLNYVLKKILIDNNKINKLNVYYEANYDLNAFLIKLNDIFKFNKITNNNNFKLFLKECLFIKNKNYDSLSLYLKSFENKNKNKNNKEKKIIKFFNEIKKNKYYDRIYIKSNIRYVINYFEELLKRRGKYTWNEIMVIV